MKAPVSRCRRKLPAAATVTMDLLGVGKDGNLYVWSEAAEVQPLNRFPMDGKHIVSGHYVIERNGQAITAHIGNCASPGLVTVQYMCGGLQDRVAFRKWVEPDLLGRVIPDAKAEAEILGMLHSLRANLIARQTAPHRKRGRA